MLVGWITTFPPLIITPYRPKDKSSDSVTTKFWTMYVISAQPVEVEANSGIVKNSEPEEISWD